MTWMESERVMFVILPVVELSGGWCLFQCSDEDDPTRQRFPSVESRRNQDKKPMWLSEAFDDLSCFRRREGGCYMVGGYDGPSRGDRSATGGVGYRSR